MLYLDLRCTAQLDELVGGQGISIRFFEDVDIGVPIKVDLYVCVSCVLGPKMHPLWALPTFLTRLCTLGSQEWTLAHSFHKPLLVLSLRRHSFKDDLEKSYESAFLVLVANNPYAFTGPQTGQRAGLTGGVLQVSVVEAKDSDALTHVAGGLVLGGTTEVEGSRSWLCDQFEVNAKTGSLEAGMDGEAVVLEAPLVVRIRPKALRVLVPEGTPEEPGIEHGPFSKETIAELLRVAKGEA